MNYVIAFVIGGLFCAVGQLMIDKTSLTPARILTGYVVGGVILSAVGLYAPLSEIAGAGASVPLSGFGHLLASGTKDAIDESGALGILSGPLSSCAAGVGAAMLFSVIAALFSRPTGMK